MQKTRKVDGYEKDMPGGRLCKRHARWTAMKKTCKVDGYVKDMLGGRLCKRHARWMAMQKTCKVDSYAKDRNIRTKEQDCARDTP